jgi:3-methyl-2-oxobutanoate hydroxymethyltransferase
MIGHQVGHPPRKVKRYADLAGFLSAAFEEYARDVRNGTFPGPEHSIQMKPGERDKLLAMTGPTS